LIGELQHYAGREQAYVKHFLLSDYLETFAHKIASGFAEICYVDGFSGPWQNTGERFEDTSFGIALGALTRAKATWRALGRDVRMSAHLIEKDIRAYRNLQAVKAQFPEVEITTHHGAFIDLALDLRDAIPTRAFAFIFIDPKGWRIDMARLAPLLRRANSEVVFNFMFDFINRAASIRAPEVQRGLYELIPNSVWRDRLAIPPASGLAEAEHRKRVLVEAFSSELGRLGDYRFVAETTVLRPTRNRPLYCLVYGTRSPVGLRVFRESQIKALRQQDMIRGRTKLTTSAAATGQNELFGSLSEMAPDPTTAFFDAELEQAEQLMKAVTPSAPDSALWRHIWPQVMERHVVSQAQLNQLAGELHRQGILQCSDWGHRKRVPDDGYRLQRPQT
jgi:three-Cys-motif partner protein